MDEKMRQRTLPKEVDEGLRAIGLVGFVRDGENSVCGLRHADGSDGCLEMW